MKKFVTKYSGKVSSIYCNYVVVTIIRKRSVLTNTSFWYTDIVWLAIIHDSMNIIFMVLNSTFQLLITAYFWFFTIPTFVFTNVGAILSTISFCPLSRMNNQSGNAKLYQDGKYQKLLHFVDLLSLQGNLSSSIDQQKELRPEV